MIQSYWLWYIVYHASLFPWSLAAAWIFPNSAIACAGPVTAAAFPAGMIPGPCATRAAGAKVCPPQKKSGLIFAAILEVLIKGERGERTWWLSLLSLLEHRLHKNLCLPGTFSHLRSVSLLILTPLGIFLSNLASPLLNQWMCVCCVKRQNLRITTVNQKYHVLSW